MHRRRLAKAKSAAGGVVTATTAIGASVRRARCPSRHPAM
jgi:hypothetical protein